MEGNEVDTGEIENVRNRIVNAVTTLYGVTEEDIFSRRRPKDVADARKACYYLARRCFGWSYPKIGDAFGRKHTTVMSGVKKMSGNLVGDNDKRAVMDKAESMVNVTQ